MLRCLIFRADGCTFDGVVSELGLQAFALPANVEAIYDSAASSAANDMAIYDTANPAAVAPT